MGTDITEPRLIMLFTEGLVEPLCGWVKAYKPVTFQDAIGCARDLQDVVPKNRFPSKPIFLPKGKNIHPP